MKSAAAVEASVSKLAQAQARLDKTFQSALMPDEEDIVREERRKAAKRRGSRADTVLTDQDLLG